MKILKFKVIHLFLVALFFESVFLLSQNYSESFFQKKYQDMQQLNLNIPGVEMMSFDSYKEFLQGSHIIFYDDGQLYQQLHQYYQEHETFKKRLSLHYSFYENQFSFALNSLGVQEVLFGEALLESGRKITWIQAEKHSTRGWINKFWHTLDACIYLILMAQYNIGPCGLSKYTSKKPLQLDNPYAKDDLSEQE